MRPEPAASGEVTEAPRRVLIANKFFHGRGGAEAYVFYLAQLLSDAGYEVIPFAMAHPRNYPTPFETYFMPYLDLAEELQSASPMERLGIAARVIYSREAARRVDQLCRLTRPQVAHLHNIYHHLSPSILGALKKHGIPIIMTLHDYKVICPTYQLLAPDGVCERCKGGHYYQAVVHRCSKDSLSASLLVAAEAYVHRFLGSYDQVDLFICPSRFLLDRMAAHGLACERLLYIPNFAPLDEFRPAGSAARGEYVIYFGRLAPEKGLGTLLKAMTRVRNIPLMIVGDGSEETRLKEQAKELGLTNVSFLPRVEKHVLAGLVTGARFAVLPSEWYENCSVSVLESFALGRAVVGARIGGMPELIEDDATGLLFRPGDPDDLALKLEALYAHPRTAEELGVRARQRAEAEFNPGRHIEQITQVYRRITGGALAAPIGPPIPENLHERRLG